IIVAPVHFRVQPERFLGIGNRISDDPRLEVQKLVDRWLRSSLQSANLLTGGMLVSLQFVPDQKAVPVALQGNAFEMPTFETGGFSGIEAGANELLRKVNTIPFDQIGAQLGRITQGLDQIANGPQLKDSLVALANTLASAQELLQTANGGLGPVLKRLPPLAAGLQQTMTDSNKLVLGLQTGYGNDTQFHRA